MSLAIGLAGSLGLGGGGAPAPSLLDIATLNLSTWFRNYPGAHPWPGSASAGGSGTPTLVNGSSPAAGTALNGRSTASYNGTTRYSDSSGTNPFWTTTAGSIAILFNASAAAADSGVATTNPCLASSSGNGQFAIDFSAGGCRFLLFSGSAKTIQIACGTGGWHFAQLKFNGTNMFARIDSGAWQSLACGTLNSVAYQVRVGANFDSTLKYTGLLATILSSPTVLSDATFDQIKAALNSYYALSL